MKIFALKPNEDWVVDRFVDEWNVHSGHAIDTPFDADIIWLTAGWCWNHLPQGLLSSKPVVCTIHHIDPVKFTPQANAEFNLRDKFVDWYHVPCNRSAKQLRRLTSKPIFIQPFWVNQRLWFPLDKRDCRRKYNIPYDSYVIGSFQRDTEGSDLKTPKLSKGPDIFCDVVEDIARRQRKKVLVLLAGWRRQYVINRLKNVGIEYVYMERPDFNAVNELYNTLDLYVVGSRYEGGPQAVFECAATQTPIISTPVGYADVLLGSYDDGGPIYDVDDDGNLIDVRRAIKNINVMSNYDNVMSLFIPMGMKTFVRFFERLISTRNLSLYSS